MSYEAEALKTKARGSAGTLISIVVLSRNRPAKLSRCVHSLLEQDFESGYEIVIIDDGSEPNTEKMGQRLSAIRKRVRYYRQPHLGIPAARNFGLSVANGDLISFVADDYVLQPDYLNTGYRYLQEHSEADAVRFRIMPLEEHFGGRVSHCYYDASILARRHLERIEGHAGRSVFLRFWKEPPPPLSLSGVTHTLEASGAAMFRSEVFEKVGGFNEHLQRGEDTEFSARFRQAGFEVHFVPSHLVHHDYDRWPFDTLRKCLLTGYWRTALGPLLPTKQDGSAGVIGKLLGVSQAFWKAKLADNRRQHLSYLPWLLAFEIATFLGFVMYCASWRRGSESSPTPIRWRLWSRRRR